MIASRYAIAEGAVRDTEGDEDMATDTRDLVREGCDLVDQMSAEELNGLVDYIRATIKTKRTQDNARAQARLKVGDRVKLTGTYKPQYLTGLTGEVIEKRQSRVRIKLDRGPVGKFKTGTVIATPAGLTVIN